MSKFNVNNITGKQGQQGPVLAGVTTMSSTGSMRIPSGSSAYRGNGGRGIFAGGGEPGSVKNIDLICLAGFMKILSKSFIKNFKGKILNIHPSLLPKYKGLNTYRKAIKNKDKYSGCTVHFVNSKLDSGKIINQKKVKVKKFDTSKSLAKRILIQEHKLYPAAILKILSL